MSFRSGTEEELNEKLTLLQEINQKDKEGKRRARERMTTRAASERERERAVRQDKLDTRLKAMRVGMWKWKGAWRKQQVMHLALL